MVNIVWTTPPGPLGTFAIGQSSTVAVSAIDTIGNVSLNYMLIKGALPPGMRLNTNGVISGTPSYSGPTNIYYSLQNYEFTIRAIDINTNTYVDSTFTLETANYTNTSTFEWVTTAGDLGTVSDGNFYSKELEAVDNYGSAVTYSFISGTLPDGLQVVPGITYNISSVGTITSLTDITTGITKKFTDGLTVIVADQLVKFFTGQIINLRSDSGTQKFYVYMLTTDGRDNNGNIAPGTSNKFALFNDNAFINPVIGGLVNPTTVYANGYLQGTPTLVGATAVKDTTYRFTIRATNAANHVTDRSFSITVTNNFEPIINPHSLLTNSTVTPYDLGSVLDGEFYSQQLSVQELNPAVNIEWKLDSGNLPPGVNLDSNGLLSGYLEPIQVDTANGPPYYDGDTYIGEIVGAGLFVPGESYTILVPGTTDFTSIGAPNNNPQTEFVATGVGSGTGTAILVSSEIITAEQQYSNGLYDGLSGAADRSEYSDGVHVGYSFTIRAFDGANYVKQSYTINVVSKTYYRADSTLSVNDSFLKASSGDVYIPVLLNSSTVLPSGRQDSYYAFKFEGYDFEGDTLTYYIANTVGTFDAFVSGTDAGFDFGGGSAVGQPSEDPLTLSTLGRTGVGFDSYDPTVQGVNNLPGLLLDSRTGWLYGKLNPQVTAYENYPIGIYVSKTKNGVVYNSQTVFFTLPVFGDVNNAIVWESSADLGTIDNGSISELSIVAKSTLGKDLVYSAYGAAGVKFSLPQGLELLPSGEISGRVSFEAFDFDDYTTTFDGDKLTIDRTHTFTVQATSIDGTVSSIKEFTLKINVVDTNPYVNLYLRAMPAFDQRQIYNAVVNDTTIFNPSLIYRPDDPWFGVNQTLDMLFLPGLKSSDLTALTAAMQKNHYTKTYTFGDVKTAVVLDSNYNIKYEVVYIEVIDPEENSAGNGPNLQIDLNTANPYIGAIGQTYRTVYPNTTQDMINRLVNNIGYEDQNSLPEWMSSNQPDLTAPNKFRTPLGYTKAVVLAYTKPTYSNLIAYRLRNSGINFNRIQFTADRYIVDNFYSNYFQSSAGTYETGPEATFDALPNRNVGKIDYTVDYGLTVPFNQINGRPVSYVQANGGLDGQTSFLSGQRLVFVQQENFNNAGPADGWIKYTDLYIGDNDTTPAVEGYSSEGFDSYAVVPGYLENAQSVVKFVGDGRTKIFTNTSSLRTDASVYINGTIQTPTVDYVISNNSIRFTDAPPKPSNANNIQVQYVTGNPDQFAGDGLTRTFTLTNTSAILTIIVDGLTQPASTYTVTNGALTFQTAPAKPAPIANIEIQSNINQRGGIWEVNILNDVVSLVFVQTVELNTRIRILSGKNYTGAIVFYSLDLIPGQSVPYWQVYKYTPDSVAKPTTFNGGGTKFFSFRDTYYTPGTQDKYLKFPQTGVFN